MWSIRHRWGSSWGSSIAHVARSFPGVLLVAIFCMPTTARADPLAYVRASSQHKSKDAATFHPINLLDDDPATIWCEGADGVGEGEELRIFFKRPQKIDRVIVGPTPKTGRRILVVQITDGINTIRVRLDDNAYVEQAFSPPMKGSKYVITIVQVGGPNKVGAEVPADVACLADMLLFLKKRPFGGRTALSSFHYNKHRDQILGPWNGGPLGAPEKFITFALDGSWSWSFEPLMGGRPKKMKGEYRFRGNRLLLRKGETGRWGDVRFKYRTIEIDREDMGAIEGDYQVISFNNALGPEFAGEYNNAEF